MNRKHVVMFSGGAASWYAGKIVANRYGVENTLLLFADTLMEDEDLYRFLEEAAKDVGAELVKISEGRNPWQIFFDVGFMGNSRVDPCSRILKRTLLRKWLEEHFEPDEVTIHLGMDWTEINRFEKAKSFWHPWKCRSPLCESPKIGRPRVMEALCESGIEPPRLYKMGFPHNNCGGFCIKAGQAQFAQLYRKIPERYAFHENCEAEFSRRTGKPVTIMKKMSLSKFRERIESGEYDKREWGGCACFAPDEYDERKSWTLTKRKTRFLRLWRRT